MIELAMERRILGLRACDSHSEALLCELPQGKRLKVRITMDRSSPHHRLFFAMLGMVADGCGRSTEDLLDVIKLSTGHVRKVRYRGQIIEVPASISWAKLDQSGFNKFFDEAVRVICEELGVKQPDLLRECKEQFPDLFGLVFRKQREEA